LNPTRSELPLQTGTPGVAAPPLPEPAYPPGAQRLDEVDYSEVHYFEREQDGHGGLCGCTACYEGRRLRFAAEKLYKATADAEDPDVRAARIWLAAVAYFEVTP
jgi:hypothetical protein